MDLCVNDAGHELLKHDKDAITLWAQSALMDLNAQMKSGPLQMIAGRLGSVWFDTNLTARGKTKKTRVCFYRGVTKPFRLMLDMTSESEW